MALLGDVFKLPQSRVTKTIVAIDLTNSTRMKAQRPEADWLTTYSWFFDLLSRTINDAEKGNDAVKGRVVKYLGDGAMAVFGEDYAADAINWAIKIQEGILDAQKGLVDCECSIGIGSGKMVEFQTPEGWTDYIGTVVDRAFRLCSAANSKAIFVDTVTVSAAAMTKVHSRYGSSTDPQRESSDYLGPEQTVAAKGFAQPIRYHEILWSNVGYGVSKDFVSDLSTTQPSPPAYRASPETRREAKQLESDWVRGTVTAFNGTYGFIRTASEEDFYFNTDYLFRRTEVKVNDVAYFLVADALANSKSRRATNMVILGSVLAGKLQRSVNPKGFGFVLCPNQAGEVRQIFVYFGAPDPWKMGMEVEFKATENQKGLSGEDPKPGVLG
ncbi:MAG: hypothetical protein HY235_04035 [Acidobacteria bacterium]|nr:hypothetical protein [Acidobacteriota bacterium]